VKHQPCSPFLAALLCLHLAAQPPGTKAEVLPISASIPEDAEIQKVITPFAADKWALN